MLAGPANCMVPTSGQVHGKKEVTMFRVHIAVLALVCASLLMGVLPLAQAQEKTDNPPTAVSPDKKLAATATDKAIRIVDVQTQRAILTVQGHTQRVTTLAFSPDGKRLASGSLDRTITFWDVPTGRLLWKHMVPTAVTRVGFSQDGKTLTSVEADKTVREFDAATGKLLKQAKN
jgi:WD40 repeat protein